MTGSKTGSYLLATFEGGGSVAPFVTIARKLIAAGHTVRIMSDAANRAEVESVGAEFVPWTAAPSRIARGREHEFVRDWEVASAFEGFCMMLDLQLVGRAADYAADVIAELERKPADMVVANDMLLGVQLACEAVGQPFVILACNVMPYPVVPGIPPMGPGLPPAMTDEDHALHAEIGAATMAVFDSRLDTYNAARAQYGLEPLEHLADQIFAADRFLLATCKAFDFVPADVPDFFVYTGPQLDDNAWSKPWSNPFAEEDCRPLVIVGFSTTFQNHAGILQRVIDALAELPVRAVVTLGGAIRPDEIKAAANTAVVESAPHNELMREAALVVTHGGHGTVMKALVHDCPMLVIPHGRDQVDNAVRVTHRRAGLSLAPDADVASLSAALLALLDEPTFAANAAVLGRRIREEAAASRIEALLEEVRAENYSRPAASKRLSGSLKPTNSGIPPAC